MMVPSEKLIIKKIFEKGYQHAARSFSLLTGINVKTGALAIELCSSASHLSHDQMPVKKSFTILSTKLLGETNGESMLILSEGERKIIGTQSLVLSGAPVSIDESAFLLELDNIISASVITEISNALNISIYGGVPNLLAMSSGSDLRNYISKNREEHMLSIRGYFAFEGFEEVKPAFIFRLKEDILKIAKRTN